MIGYYPSSGVQVIGSYENDTIYGSSYVDVLYGNDGDDLIDSSHDGNGLAVNDIGDDTIYGGSGNDTIYGGGGNDVIGGDADMDVNGNGTIDEGDAFGYGDDIIDGGDGDDYIYDITGNNILKGGQGNDTITGSTSLEGGKGNDLLVAGQDMNNNYIFNLGDGQDTITENYGNDTLSFGTGIRPSAVTMVRSGSNMIFKISGTTDQVTVENWFAGSNYHHIEQVKFADAPLSSWTVATMQAFVPALYTATSEDDFTAGWDGIDNIDGSAGNDNIFGYAGNDTLSGGAGNDTIYGGDGDDTYVVDSIGDVVMEQTSAGTDTVRTSISYTLGAEVENLTLTGTGAINGTGNALGNVLTGNSAANTLNGGVGNDVLTGGLGADKLTGGTGADRFDFNALAEMGLTSTTRDTIADFKTSEADKIDLLGVDANTLLTGNQAFTFLGAVSAFTGDSTGKLRFDATAHILYGSTDVDTDAEFAILLTGVNNLTSSDLVL